MVKNNVFINGKSVVTQKSGGKTTAFPDVCKTPTPGGPVPIPYPNIAKSSDIAKGSKTVKMEGAPVCLKGSNFSTSTGDEAGTAGGGVASSKTKGIAEPINYSFDVKIEGKNVVRNLDLFLNNNKNTPPTPVLQSQGAPPVAVVNKEPEKELFKCDWKLCDGKHPEKVEYPNREKGSVSRGKTSNNNDYAGEWVDAGLEPWDLNGPGKKVTTVESDFTKDIDPSKPNNREKINEALSLRPDKYVSQKHHLISVHLFNDYPFISHNAKLIGYNVNDKENAACFPYFRIDILRHDLQCHRGPHPEPKYDALVNIKLRKLEVKCKKFCGSDNQEKLKIKLNDIAADAFSNLKNWEQTGWYLRTSPEADREWAMERIKNHN